MRLIYYCSNPRKPSGGVYVIYRHVMQLNQMGINAAVLHKKADYIYQWAKGQVPILHDHELTKNDYFIISELMIAEITPKLISHSLPYAIFLQNGYYLSHPARTCRENDVDFAYQNAHSILSISDDTSNLIKLTYPQLSERILRLYCSLSKKQFHPNDKKENWISYMPRKNCLHAEALIFILKKKIPTHWRIVAINDVTHEQAAEIMRKSRIFLSFSHLEGLGLPPIEAAMSGNYVIGYHGNGGLEYWHAPNFSAVAVGDMGDFVNKIQARITQLDQSSSLEKLMPGIIDLQQTYSAENEKKYLANFVEHIKMTNPEKPAHQLAIKIQKRKKFSRFLHQIRRCFCHQKT